MTKSLLITAMPLMLCATLEACSTEPAETVLAPTAARVVASQAADDADGTSRFSDWSVPINVGAPVNSACTEQAPALSKDGLALYFASNRGAVGANACQASNDIWVSERPCEDCPWQEPVNLGPVVNSASGDGGPSLSNDEHLLFFTSGRAAAPGMSDVYVSRRTDKKDHLSWGVPQPLGSDVNTPVFEGGADYLQNAEEGACNLYFSRGPTGMHQDIYCAPIKRDGETRGPAVVVTGISDPATHEASPSLRADAREIFFWSGRPGGVGGGDLWTSTRPNVHTEWLPPTNLGPTVNSATLDRQPGLSFDALTLVFSSFRAGSRGEDIWMTTRKHAP